MFTDETRARLKDTQLKLWALRTNRGIIHREAYRMQRKHHLTWCTIWHRQIKADIELAPLVAQLEGR